MISSDGAAATGRRRAGSSARGVITNRGGGMAGHEIAGNRPVGKPVSRAEAVPSRPPAHRPSGP